MLGLGSLLEGLVFLCAVLGLVSWSAALALQRWCSALQGYLRVLAFAVLATAFLLGVEIVPGALGLLTRGTVLGAACLGSIAVWALARRPGWRAHLGAGECAAAPARRVPVTHQLLWLPAFAAVGLVLAFSLHYLRGVLPTVPLGVDALDFHLPGVAGWIHTGSVWTISQFLPQLANGNYPNNGDAIFLAFVLPFHSALLVRLAMLPYFALIPFALYAVARELDAPRRGSLLFAASVCAIPAVARPALFDTQTDTLMLFGFAAGIAFLLRHGRTRRHADLVLAGLALGISFGTKWYAVPCVLLVLALWILARAYLRESVARLVRHTGWLLGLVLLLGGFWLVRNLVKSADPFFPLKVSPLGITIFNAPPDTVRQKGGFTISDYLTSWHVLRMYVLPALRTTVTWLGALLGASALCTGVLAGWDARRAQLRSRSGVVMLLALGVVGLAVVYSLTPDTALGPRNMPTGTGSNARYLMPAVVLAAPLAAWLSGRLGRLGLLLEIAGLAFVIQALSTLYGLHSPLTLVIAALITAAALVWRGLRFQPLARAAAAWTRPLPLAATSIVVVIAVGFWARPRFSYETYSDADATFSWLLAHAPSGHTIGLADVWSVDGLPPVLPAFGPRLGNRVAYVGPFVQHMLQQYPTEAQFQAGLRRGRFDLLEIGLGFPTPQPTVPDEAWARAIGYREVARSRRLVLLERPQGLS